MIIKQAKTYEEAFKFVTDLERISITADIGIDIGKQFGTRMVIRISPMMARHLLTELQKRDLPLPMVLFYEKRILIGAEPE